MHLKPWWYVMVESQRLGTPPFKKKVFEMEPLALKRHFVTIDSSLPPQAYHLARKCSWEIMESLTITSWAIGRPTDLRRWRPACHYPSHRCGTWVSFQRITLCRKALSDRTRYPWAAPSPPSGQPSLHNEMLQPLGHCSQDVSARGRGLEEDDFPYDNLSATLGWLITYTSHFPLVSFPSCYQWLNYIDESWF
jgi:hypothetical protein